MEKFEHYRHTVTPLDIDLHMSAKNELATEGKSNDFAPFINNSQLFNSSIQQNFGENEEYEVREEKNHLSNFMFKHIKSLNE